MISSHTICSSPNTRNIKATVFLFRTAKKMVPHRLGHLRGNIF